MNTTGFVKYAGALVALAILSACGGVLRQGQDDMAVAPSAGRLDATYVGRTLFVNGRPVTAARLSPLPIYATIVPDRHAKAKTFEYVFNDYESYASIFDYPKSNQQAGSITGVGGQGCTNVLYGYGKKTIWIVAGPGQITEYAVPMKELKALSDSVGNPSSCAMNTSGDLAVGILYNYFGPGGGDIIIFKHASGSGTVMTTPLAREYFDGYDNKGNLFFDGLTSATTSNSSSSRRVSVKSN